MGNIIKFKIIKQKRGLVRMKDIGTERKLEIEDKVQDIISRYTFSGSPSVDIVSLVKNDNFVVQSSEMDIDTTGCLIVSELETVMGTKRNKLIVVNQHFINDGNDENYVLKKSRFITAHEYGHYVLHKLPKHPIYAHRDTRHRTEPHELEADYFARSILMPYKNFCFYFNEIKRTDSSLNNADLIGFLSNIFNVTKDKVKKRIDDLNELECYIDA